jgi:hypothetical protein
MTYHDKHPIRTPYQSGHGWTLEKLNTPGESHKQFRMNAGLFYMLHDLLVDKYGLKSTIHMSSMESLAIFPLVCGQAMSNVAIDGIFKHSSETISRKFEEALICLVSMGTDYMRPVDHNFSNTHPRICNDRRMMPHFKDCIGALDGTHISATPRPNDLITYIGRSGTATQNVLAMVGLDMRFTYASVGQPGSMHDTNVLFHALELDADKFPHTPPLGMSVHLSPFFLKSIPMCMWLIVISFIFNMYVQANIIWLMSGTQIDLDICHHTRVKGIMCRIGGEGRLHMVSKSISTICIQVFATW